MLLGVQRWRRVLGGQRISWLDGIPNWHCRRPPEGHPRGLSLCIIGLTVASILVAGCSDPGESCDVCFTEAVAYGRVTDAGGGPVEGVRVDVGLSAASCSDTSPIIHSLGSFSPGWTNATGRYRSVIVSLFAPFTAACADVTANTLGDPAWSTSKKTFPTSLEFREEGEPHDSARYDMVVEARGGA